MEIPLEKPMGGKSEKPRRGFYLNVYLFKFNNRDRRKRCEICSKLIIKTPERLQSRRSGVFMVNFEHISHLFPLFLLLTLNK